MYNCEGFGWMPFLMRSTQLYLAVELTDIGYTVKMYFTQLCLVSASSQKYCLCHCSVASFTSNNCSVVRSTFVRVFN